MRSNSVIIAVAAMAMTLVAGQLEPMPPGTVPVVDKLDQVLGTPMPHVVSDLETQARPILDVFHTKRAVASPADEVMTDLSYTLGYLLAGAAESHEQLEAACNSPAVMAKYAKIGLNTSAINAPICNSTIAMPNATYAIVNSIFYQSKIFTSQLINSVNNTQRLEILCNRLILDLIDFFPLIGEVVKDGVCEAAGTQRAPQGYSNRFTENKAAVKAAKNTQSVLFAILYAASAQSATELAVLCTMAPNYAKSLNAEHINGDLVTSTLCNISQPIPVPVVKGMIRSWMTRYYVTILENVSKAENWKQWLCQNVDEAKMDAVGLSGQGVKGQMCGNDTAMASTNVDDYLRKL